MSIGNSLEAAAYGGNIPNMSEMSASVTPDVLVSDEAMRMFSWINFLVSFLIGVFGTGANVLNIICFARLDLKDAINISFLGLAISDLGSVLTMLWICLCLIPAFRESDLPFDPMDFQFLVTGWPHIMFTRITSWITALVTLERCLCITMPLKVKTILTSRRVTIIIVCTFLIIAAGVSPIYYCTRLAWTFVPKRNRTILKIAYTDDRLLVEQIAHSITNIFIPVTAYATVIICTVTLVIKLRQKTKWRMKSTVKTDADTLSERDQKVAKMVVMISSLFIACFIPLSVLFVLMILEPRISIGGQYQNALTVFGGIAIILEGTNSSLNIFIYYRMSSKYRTVFRQLFGRTKT